MTGRSGVGANDARLHMRCYAGPAVVETRKKGWKVLNYEAPRGIFKFQDVCVW